MELYKKDCNVLISRVSLFIVFLIGLCSCSEEMKSERIEVDLFAHDINFTKRALFAAQDSLGFTIVEDLKFKDSKRERRNEVHVFIPRNKVESLLDIIKSQSEIESLPIESVNDYRDSVNVILKVRYHK